MAGVTREVRESEGRLGDRVGIGLLTRFFPPELVDEVVDAAGAREQRRRSLPARLVVYLVLALWLFPRSGADLVLGKLTAGLRRAGLSAKDYQVPRTGSIAKARHRLKSEVMRLLFARTAGPVGQQDTPGVFWRGYRLCSLDGSTLDVANTEENLAEFGKPTNQGAGGLYPQVRIMVLAECGTQALIDAAVDGYRVDERTLARRLLPSMKPGMLVLGDQGLPGYQLWSEAIATGAKLVWRAQAPSAFPLPVLAALPDGGYLSELNGANQPGRPPSIPVRVIEYNVVTTDLDTHEHTINGPFVLITNLTDPDTAPAEELAGLYRLRWEAETVLDALKTQQRGPGLQLRSQKPEGVRQEVWSMFCVYQSLRDLICHAAHHTDTPPARISFKRALEAARDSATRDFSP